MSVTLSEAKNPFEVSMFAAKAIPNEIIDARINSFKKVYLFLAVVGLAGVLIYAADGDLPGILNNIVNIVVSFAVYYGLKEKRKWVIPLVLIFSAYSLLSHFINFLDHSPSNIETIPWPIRKLVDDFFDFAWILFCAYQIYLFSKKEVRESFGIKGFLIFS